MEDGASIESPQENLLFAMRRDNYAHQFIEGNFLEWGNKEGKRVEVFKTPKEIVQRFDPWLETQKAGAEELKKNGQPADISLEVLDVFTLTHVADYAQKKLEAEKKLPHGSTSSLVKSWEAKAKLAKEVTVVSETLQK